VSQFEATQQRRQTGVGTFLVFRDGECVPLDGPMRVERLRGCYYLLGELSWERCGSREAAQHLLLERMGGLDPHRVAAEALETLEDEALDPIFGPP
jgi:hypothetical protein